MISSLLLALTALDLTLASPLGASDLLKRASYNNKANAASILERATILPKGSYTMRAISSQNWVTYNRAAGQNFFPDAGATAGAEIKLEYNTDGDFANSTRISPAASNAKCVSAQWDAVHDGGSDWAGVLYNCAVGSGPVVTGLRPAKQWWYLLSASGLPQGPSPYYIIPVDHVTDMKTRGFTDCSQRTGGPPANANSICIEMLANNRDDQIWDIQPFGSASTPVKTTAAPTTKAATTTKATSTSKSATTAKATSTKKPTSSAPVSSARPSRTPLLPPLKSGKTPRDVSWGAEDEVEQ